MGAQGKRSVILLGHAQSGKTTLAESLLFFCKATTRKGSIADGTTVSDYSFDEIEHKHSVNLSLLYCDYKGCRVQILDTPGYADFFGEMAAGVRAVDAAVVVVDASGGVAVGTERAWQQLEESGIPCVIFINKTDKPADPAQKVLENVRNLLSGRAHAVGSLDAPELIEAVAESDDKLLEKYLEAGTLSVEEVRSALPAAVRGRRVFPVVQGSALHDTGIGDLLEVISAYLPGPLDRPAVPAHDPADMSAAIEVVPSENGPLSAFVFKNISDPYVGQLTVLRVFSGTLLSHTGFYNVNKKARERIGQIYLLQGKEQRAVDAAACGDIVAIAKLKDAGVSDSLCDEKGQVLFAPLVFPEPAISASVKPKSREDEEKISIALHKLAAEDPTLRVSHDPHTQELIISGLGDLHLGVMVGRLKKRFNVEVELATPKVSYKETITRSAKVQGNSSASPAAAASMGMCG